MSDSQTKAGNADANSSTGSRNGSIDKIQAGFNVNKPINYHHKREPAHRVFVNRSLQLSKIKFFGFDMDYTLAVYKSPQYEILAFKLVVDHLITLGYPEEIKNFVYDPSFPVRGLWYDKTYGHLLKVDTYGNILICVHGFKFLKSNEIRKFYPNKYLIYDESRIYVLSTLFNLPEAYLLACIVNYFTTSPKYQHHDTGVSCDKIFVTYKAIYQDVRLAIDFVHNGGKLKQLTVEDIDHYVIRDDRLPVLLSRIHENNAKVFLLTNSGYDYTDKIMGFMLNDKDKNINWRQYFDYIVVDAHKPLFFEEGTSLKEIIIDTGKKNFGTHAGPLLPNQVYCGGSCDVFSKLIGSRGKDVLYVGDHIFGDIIKSKKERAWRTFLIVPELAQELLIWHEKRNVFSKIEELDMLLADMLINLDSSAKKCPDVSYIKSKIQKHVHDMDMQYGLLGSLFRSGSRQTHFASQITRYADIYAHTHLNLLHYPFFYLFKAPQILMPHESTVNPHEEVKEDSINLMNRPHTRLVSRSSNSLTSDGSELISESFANELNNAATNTLTAQLNERDEKATENGPEDKMQRSVSIRPITPPNITHHADFDDDDDEESDEAKSNNTTLNSDDKVLA